MRLTLIFALCTCFSLNLIAQKNVLEKIIRQEGGEFGPWAEDPQQYEIQVLYTQIDRDENNKPSFTTHRFGIDPNTYFYPASTVKMPAAIMALEKLNEISIRNLDAQSTMLNFAATSPQTSTFVDTSAMNDLPSIENYIRKIFLVSDNDAFNRLYEFIGQGYFNRSLHDKGYSNSRIIHRLSVSGFDTLRNRLTNPILFHNDEGILYQQQEVYSQFYDDFGLSGQVKGRAYMTNEGELVPEAFDFRYKNFVSLQNLHDILKAIIFPEEQSERARFNLTVEDFQILHKAMAEYPRESVAPAYSEANNYVKFWSYGDLEDDSISMPDHIRVFNKVGWAYGFLTDVSYIVDLENDVEYFLAGVIHVNANETFNDGIYEYDEIGLPFFGELGRAVHQYELDRRRRHKPDLSWIRNIFPAD